MRSPSPSLAPSMVDQHARTSGSGLGNGALLADVTPRRYASSAVDTRYLDRKLAGLCTRGSCKAVALDGEQLCAEHKAKEAKRDAKRQNQIRAVRRRNGMCAMCGQYKSKTYRCARCLLIWERSPAAKEIRASSSSVTPSVPTPTAADRIAAATRVDSDNRSRYHGRDDRGPPPKAVIDAQDIKSILKCAAQAEAELALARGPTFADRPKRERVAAEHEALSRVDQARRFCDEVLERNRYHADIDRMVPG